jgi:hypothetical protein
MSENILAATWIQHPSYPDYYFSSSGDAASRKSGKFRLLKGTACGKSGYKAICVEGKKKIYIHRAVCELFNGPQEDGQQCRHLDGSIKNNHASNLKWGSAKENNEDKILHGTNGEGEKNPMSKLKRDQVDEIRKRVPSGETQRSMCKIFNVSPMTISRVVRRELWK